MLGREPGSARRRSVRVLGACALALIGLAGPAALGATGTVTPTPGQTRVASSVVTAGTDDPGIVVVGTGGLQWTDIDRMVTPTLWRMTGQGSVASISVRTVGPETCRVDAWLTLSATRRMLPVVTTEPNAASTPADGPEDVERAAEDCRPVPDVVAGAEGAGPADVASWTELAVVPAEPDAGILGTLGTSLAAAGTCTTAVGPGAAVALADGAGHLERYLASTDEIDADLLSSCPVTLIDAGEPAADPEQRQVALRRLDELVAAVVEAVPDGWRVVVAGVHDTPVDELGLQVVIDWRKGTGQVGWLTSDSTRRPGIVTLTDVAATVLASGGAVVDDLEGAPFVIAGERRMGTERTVENRRYLTELTTTVPHLVPVFLGVLGLGVLGALGALVLTRRRVRRPELAVVDGAPGSGGPGVTARRTITAVLLLAACGPVGAYLATLSRWWGAPSPTVVATIWTAVAATAAALVAWGLSRLLRPGFWGLGGTVAGLTWLVLTVDGLTGTTLQHGSLLGVTATLGARYFGFGNLTFAVYLTAALVLAGSLAAGLVTRRARIAVPGLVLVIGLVTVLVDGWPAFGADFGGVFAIVPAFAMLLMAVLHAAATPRRILVTVLVTVATVGVVAVVDWLQPTGGSHLGLFVQRLVDGEAWPVVANKAAGAWQTIAHPAGAVATVACIAGCVALVGPARVRPAAVDAAYRRVPMLRPVVRSVVVAAVVGTLLNDSGIAVGASVLAMAGVLVAASWAGTWPRSLAAADVAPEPPRPVGRARMPAAIVAVGGGLLGAMLLGSVVAPGLPVAAGDVTTSGATMGVDADRLVVIGTSGVRWEDVSRVTTPTLWRMLRDGAAAGGVTGGVTGADRRCQSAGWLALSAGRAPVTGEWIDGEWTCAPWVVDTATAPTGSAVIAGWDRLTGLQASSGFRPRLGVLAEALADADACATAVGPGAALALADSDGAVDRYRTLDAALADGDEAFATCRVTVVDAGAALGLPSVFLTPDVAVPSVDPETDQELAAAARQVTLTDLDATVQGILQAVPSDATVLLVDVGDPTSGRPSLGIGLSHPGGESARFLSTASTRWEGVIRLLDVPTTVLATVGAANPPELSGSPVTLAGSRPSDVGVAVNQLAELSTRDHALRTISGSVATIPMLISLALFGVALRLGRRPVRAARARRVSWVLEAALLLLAAMPAGVFLMAAWGWWRLDRPGVGMWVTMIASTVLVAGLGAMAPRRPAWAAPAVIATVTAGILTYDALLGTPLHRASPLGPAPTLGGRYYGFGNPTYSVFVVAAVVAIAAIGTWLVRRGQRRAAVVVTIAASGVTLVVDLWPTLGADVGGGLVLVPVCAVVVLAVAGVKVSLRRLAVIGVAGLVVVAAIGVLDWLRPAADRSHLGRFVQSVLDQTAWETVVRKAGFAASTVTSGPTAWLTIAVVVMAALVLRRGSRLRAAWFTRVEAEWPMVRPVLFALVLAALGGALVNDYGVRVATIMLFAAVPLFGLLVVRTLPADEQPDPQPDPQPPSGALPCDGPSDTRAAAERSGP